MLFGSFLKNARESKGITQQEISDKLGFSSPQFISNCERGVANLPPKHFKPVSKMIGIDTERLIKLYIKDFEMRVRKSV